MKRLFVEADPYTGLQSEYLWDGRNLTERVTASRAHTSTILDANARLANESGFKARGIKEDWMLAARVPAEVQLEWLMSGYDIQKMTPEEILKKCREREYDKLRTVSGRI